MTVERFLLGLHAMKQQGMEIIPSVTTQEMTPSRAVGLMLRSNLCQKVEILRMTEIVTSRKVVGKNLSDGKIL